MKENAVISAVAVSCTLGLAFVYLYRLPSFDSRLKFWDYLRSTVNFDGRALPKAGFQRLYKAGVFENILAQATKKFCENFEVAIVLF
jgi:hypothetical protein